MGESQTVAQLNLNRLTENLNRMGALGVIIASVSRALRVIAVGGVREGFQTKTDPDGRPWRRLAHARPDGSTEQLQDSGRLKASVKAEVSARQLILLASHPGANLHQYGGTVTPKAGKFLAIPVTREAKRAGRPRNFRQLMYARMSGDKSSGVLIGAGRRGDSQTVQFVLVKSVTVPARVYLGFSRKTLDKIETVIADAVSAWLASPWQANPWEHFNIRQIGS